MAITDGTYAGTITLALYSIQAELKSDNKGYV